MLRPIFLFLLLLAVNSQIYAQNLLVYYESQPGQNQTDTLYVYFQSLTGQAVDVSSVTLSVCYTSAAQLDPAHVSSTLASQWGNSLEVCQSDAELASYEGTQFTNRAKYAITTLNPLGINVPSVNSGLGKMMLKLPFQVSGSSFGQYYLENTLQNPVNEIGDLQGDAIDFVTWNAAYPFPVEWLDFQANQTEEGDVNLTWQTGMEINNRHFEVEKSYDGELFQVIGRVNSQASGYQNYRFLDESFMQGVMFYRIKQVDINGASSHSNTLKVNFSHQFSQGFTVSPNPFQSEVNIRKKSNQLGEATIQLIDLTGRVMLRAAWDANAEELVLPTDELSPGLYLLQIIDSFGKIENTPLVKK